MEFSPTGKQVVPSVGPLNAKIVIVGESPAREELAQGVPLVGKSGKLLNKALVSAGINRDDCYIMNCIPVRAPGDKFALHDPRDIQYGRTRFNQELASLTGAVVYLALGANAAEWLLGQKPPIQQYGEGKREGFIGQWRGTVINTDVSIYAGKLPEGYLRKLDFKFAVKSGFIIPTYHPAAILRQMNWHPWLLMDVKKAALVASTGVQPPTVTRKWYINDVKALRELANSDCDLISVDSELDPYIIGIATEDEVHVFVWDESYRGPLEKLLGNPKVMKIAHRWVHDHTFFRKVLEIEVEKPYVDTLGLAYVLNTSMEKSLSPHISTRFTNWGYHKWLSNTDALHYCGMDAVVCYDAYWPQIDALKTSGLWNVADHDHQLLTPLMTMQAKGFKIDENDRVDVEKLLKAKLTTQEAELTTAIAPIVEKRISKFQKPHLFRVDRKCDCCGGGNTQRKHCGYCSYGAGFFPTKEWATAEGFKTIKALKESLVPCRACEGSGKIKKALPFNPDSPDQIADVIYRGLGIAPRRFKGEETVKAAQLDPLREKHPIIGQIVDLSKVRADLDTVERLHAGQDGLLHCEFDPWGTDSGRIAGSEGLIEVGTNPMNLPKEARRFVVPREGYTFLYPDMAQIEARAMAVLSGDKNLKRALYEPIASLGKADYHTWLLQAISEYDSRIVISRDQSKRVSYAGFYGARPEQLGKELTAEAFRKGKGMSVDAKMANTILQALYRVCPEIPRWQNSVADEVLRTRKLKNPFTGREFTFPGYIADKKNKGELDYEVKKKVWSRLPQDIGAWILGLGLIDIYYTSGEWGKLLTPLVHVHDALLIEAPTHRLSEAEPLALKHLSRYIWDMDFPAEIKRGMNWYEAS